MAISRAEPILFSPTHVNRRMPLPLGFGLRNGTRKCVEGSRMWRMSADMRIGAFSGGFQSERPEIPLCGSSAGALACSVVKRSSSNLPRVGPQRVLVPIPT